MEERDVRVAEMEDVIRLALCESMWSSQVGRGRLGKASDGLTLLPRSCRQALSSIRSLSAGGKATLARCIGRRDEWIRVACGFEDGGKCGRAKCVRHCVDPHDLVKDRRELTASVCRELVECGAVTAFPPEGDVEDIEDRVTTAASVARSSILTNAQRRAWLVATNTHHRKGLTTTTDYVKAITAYASQRSLGGGAPPLWAPLRAALSSTPDASGDANDKTMPVLLRINADVVHAVRRARRLYVAVVDGGIRASGLRAPAIALYLPSEHHAPASARLWVHERRMNNKYLPFPSRRDFLCWEAAVELRAAQDAAIETTEVDESLELWDRRHRRRLEDEATLMKETLKAPLDLEKERQAEKGRAKQRAQNSREYRELGPLPDDTLLESLNSLFDRPDSLNVPLKEPETKKQKISAHNSSEDVDDDDDEDDDRCYDQDESFSARSAAVGRVLADRCGEEASLRRYALWAVACLRKCMTWRRLSEGGRWSDLEADFPDAQSDWEGPFADLEFRIVLVEIAFRGISGKAVGSLEAIARNKRDRWQVVDLLRFLIMCCLGPAAGEWRGRIRSRLSICLSGRKAPRDGQHLKCPRARLGVVSLALGDRDMPADIRVEFEKCLVALYKKRNADGIEDAEFCAGRQAMGEQTENGLFPIDVVEGGNPLSRRTGEHSQIVSHREDEWTLGVSVEEYALEHYALDGWYGIHCEGRPLRPLAILLLWDCIYADDDCVDGAFVTPWQVWPRDLRAPRDVFRRRRKRHLDDILTRVRDSDDLALLVENAYCAHLGKPALSDVPPLSFLQAVALGMGPAPLASFLDAFAGRFTTSGLPDLLMLRVTLSDGNYLDPKDFRSWIGNCRETESGDDSDDIDVVSPSPARSETDDEQSKKLRQSLPLEKRSNVTFEIRLVEVKSYNDSLWEGQIVWLAELLKAGIDARVATLPLTPAAAATLRKEKSPGTG